MKHKIIIVAWIINAGLHTITTDSSWYSKTLVICAVIAIILSELQVKELKDKICNCISPEDLTPEARKIFDGTEKSLKRNK